MAGEGHVFGEAVDDGGVGLVFAQESEGVAACVAGVDDEWQTAGVGGLDVGDEALVLPCQVAFAPVVVQACFADADDFGVLGVLYEFVKGEFCGIGVVGVDADCGEDMGLLFGDCENGLKAVAADADGQSLQNIGIGHVLQDFR